MTWTTRFLVARAECGHAPESVLRVPRGGHAEPAGASVPDTHAAS